MNNQFPPVLCNSDRKLPSDSVFRHDLMYWNLKDNINGQIWKENLENL